MVNRGDGPKTTGKHCPEGWPFHQVPGPNFKGTGVESGAADSNYYNWLDKYDSLGAGKNVPIAMIDTFHRWSSAHAMTCR